MKQKGFDDYGVPELQNPSEYTDDGKNRQYVSRPNYEEPYKKSMQNYANDEPHYSEPPSSDHDESVSKQSSEIPVPRRRPI